MSARQFFSLLPLLALILLTSWMLYRSFTATQLTQAPLDHPDFYGYNVKGQEMDPITGSPKYDFFAKQLTHYPQGNTTDAIEPQLIIYNPPPAQPWHISADKGQARNGLDIIFLSGHVKGQQNSTGQNQPTTINTTELTVYPNTQIAETQAPVTASQPGGTVNAIGARIYLKTGIVNLLSKVHGVYQSEPTTPSKK